MRTRNFKKCFLNQDDRKIQSKDQRSSAQKRPISEKNNAKELTVLPADQMVKGKKSAIKTISNTGYPLMKTVEEETSTKEKRHRVLTREEKNIRKK